MLLALCCLWDRFEIYAALNIVSIVLWLYI